LVGLAADVFTYAVVLRPPF